MSDGDDSLLRIEVASLKPGVSADAFLASLRRALDILAELNRSLSEFGSATVEWEIVASSMNSPLATVLKGSTTSKHNGHVGAMAVDRFVAGIRHLGLSDERPTGFTEKALKDVADLLIVVPKGVTEIKVQSVTPKGRVKDSAKVSKSVTRNARQARDRLVMEEARRAGKYRDYGTLEGRLRDLLGSKNRLVLVDELTGNTTSCYIKDEKTDQKAREAWKGRVSVSGYITYDRVTNDALDVEVDELRLLRDSSLLPQFEDFSGIDLTGGRDSAELVRESRDDN